MDNMTKTDEHPMHRNSVNVRWERALSDIRYQLLVQFKYHNLTLEQWAERSGVSVAVIRDVCYGSAPIGSASAGALIAAFGLELRISLPVSEFAVGLAKDTCDETTEHLSDELVRELMDRLE
jgi:hypothetical protein